jgi:predicted permease
VGRDARLAVRLLRLSPAFAAVAILSLALGVGANTAIFQLIDAVVLRTLPVASPQELANVPVIHDGRVGSSVSRQHEISSAIWEQLQEKREAFSSIAAWSTERFDLGHGGEGRYADGMWVSGAFFDTLQVRPVLGRLLAPGDDTKGCGLGGAVISYSFWQGEFGGRTDALGSTISLNRRQFQVIGVTPASFTGLEVGLKFDIALPLCSEPAMRNEGSWTSSSTTWWLAVIGRLRPGWSFHRASAQLASISPGIFAATLPAIYEAAIAQKYLRFRFHAVPAATGVSPLRNHYQYPLYLLLAISGLVLLIACANIANLMLVRASARRHEMAMRLALGASRARLIRQLLVESLLLGAAGTALGAVLARLLSQALIAGISKPQSEVFLSLSIDWRVLAFTTGLGMATCVLFGVAPAIQAANTEPGAVVKTAGRAATPGRRRLLVRRGFIVSQIALSLVLVVAALLFVRTFQNLANLNAGFEQANILVADFDASPLKLPVERRSQFERELLARVRATPGVLSAAQTAIVPLGPNDWNDFIDVPGTDIQGKVVNMSEASSDYFRTLSVPVLSGRDFNDADTLDAPRVAIVNEAFAKKLFGGAGPVGRTFGIRQNSGKLDKLYRIVGLVGNTKYADLREELAPIIYLPDTQDPEPDSETSIMIRSNEDTSSLVSALKSMSARISPEIVINFSVFRTSIRESLGRERLMATLSGFYGLLAAVLSMVGLYGVMSFSVAQRRSEIGIRMALGATRSGILFMVVREALKLLALGLAFGAILVIAAGRTVQALLFGLKPMDPLTLGGAATGMAIVALAASLIPAQRAARVHPMQTLREE